MRCLMENHSRSCCKWFRDQCPRKDRSLRGDCRPTSFQRKINLDAESSNRASHDVPCCFVGCTCAVGL
jgi:hypothetical protein